MKISPPSPSTILMAWKVWSGHQTSNQTPGLCTVAYDTTAMIHRSGLTMVIMDRPSVTILHIAPMEGVGGCRPTATPIIHMMYRDTATA